MKERGRGLEFLVGTHSIVVAAALVERVVEVELSPPPPLARPWVGGFGVSEGSVFVAIDLAAGAARGDNEHLPVCVLLDTGPAKGGLRWALRVTRTVGFVDVTRGPRNAACPSDWPSWVAGADVAGSRKGIGLLDVSGMAQDFEK